MVGVDEGQGVHGGPSWLDARGSHSQWPTGVFSVVPGEEVMGDDITLCGPLRPMWPTIALCCPLTGNHCHSQLIIQSLSLSSVLQKRLFDARPFSYRSF